MSQDMESRVAALELKIQNLEDREAVRTILADWFHLCTHYTVSGMYLLESISPEP